MNWIDWLSSLRGDVAVRRPLRKRRAQGSRAPAAIAQPLETRVLLASQLGAAAQSTNSSTLSFTVAAGHDRLLVVSAGDANTTGISSVTFNGTPLTQQVQQDDFVATGGIWTLALGTSDVATAGTIQVTSDGDGPTFIGAVAFQRVNQAAPVSATAQNFGEISNSSSSLVVASETDDIVYDLFYSWDDIASSTANPGAAQTLTQSVTNLNVAGVFNSYRTSQQPGTASATMSWTSDDDGFIHTVINVKSTPDAQVNTYTTSEQPRSSVAMDADGDYVVVWQSFGQDGNNYGIYAQRYTAVGNAIGGEFRVNTYTTGSQIQPSIAMDADGDFVIAWQSSGQDGNDSGIYAQRYNAVGVAQGSEFRVNTYTTGSQRNPTVALGADGDFVVAWASDGQDSSGYGIYAQRYNALGVAQGSEFRVNSYTTANQQRPSVALDADGDFVVAWQSFGQDGSSDGIYAQRYNAVGVAQGSEFRVNSYTNDVQGSPTVALDADGDFVIAWLSVGQDGSNYGVYAQRYNAAGVAQGSEFRVNTYTTGIQRDPSVSMDADGDFVITWGSDGQDGSGYGIYAQRYSALGVAQGSEFRVNSYTTGSQRDAALAMDADGDFIVTWESSLQDGSGYGVYSQRYTEFGSDTAGPTVTNVLVNNFPLTNNGRLASPPSTLTVLFSENTAGGSSGANSVTNINNWTLTRDGVNVTAATLSGITFGLNGDTNKYEAVLTFAGPLAVGNYVLTALPAIRDAAGNSLDGDLNGTPGGNFSRSFVVQPSLALGNEFRVNSYTTDNQGSPSVARDADGDFVVAWETFTQDGSFYGVYAQRYNAAGVAQGSEFRVNSYTTNSQDSPSVAMDADGDFVIAWRSDGQDGSSAGIYAQRYNAAGVAQGSEFRVNTYTTGIQREPSVSMDADGDFVVTWASDGQDGSSYGVYAQRYNAQGIAQGSEFRVNNFTTSAQSGAEVALDADGDFVVTWHSIGQDGSSYGIYVQRYNAVGVAQGVQFRVNTYTTNNQRDPTVSLDADGDFVIAWRSNTQDGSDFGVYAQRFNAAGAGQGTEFRVNSFTTNAQIDPDIALDADGDFVVTWRSVDQDGGGNGIYAQRYNAQGIAQGSEFRVNSYTTGNQRVPSVAMDADGDFVIAWASQDQDGSSYGVYAQRYAINLPPTAATGLTLTATEDTAVNGYLLWGSDPETAIDNLTFNITTPPTKGTLVRTGARRFNFVPAANANGSDLFQFTVSDGLNTSAPATVNITINPVNDLPTASTGLTITTNEDTPVIGYSLWGFDVETPLNSLVFNISTAPTKGALVKTGQRSFNYIPSLNANGADSFQFTVTDGNGAVSAPATVNITINAVNDLPEAYDGSATTPSNQAITGARVWGWDPEATALTYSVVGSPVNGTVNLQPNGNFTFSPTANFVGTASFQFRVTDAQSGQSNTATMTITVTNRVPIAYDGTATTQSNQAITGARVWGWDPEGQALTYSVVGSPVNGTVNLQTNGNFTFTPNTNFVGTASFQFRVTDSLSGQSNTATMSISVTNRVPEAYSGNASMVRNTTLTGGRVWGWDPEGTALTFSVVGSPVNGTVNLQTNGFFSFTPTTNFTGTASFQFRVTDANGGISNTATMTINVAAADPPRSLLASLRAEDEDDEEQEDG
jgi:hypothetical protein